MYSFKVSTRKNKKYDVFKDNKYLTSFGDKRYEHYYDKIGHYSNLNHLDKVRRDNYYKRFGKTSKFESPKYFSHNYLW